MMISPKARRVIADAVRSLPDPKARDTWRAWAERPTPGDLPENVAAIALSALELATGKIQDCLKFGPDEDLVAELANDLCFIRAIEDDIRREVVRGLAVN